MAMQQNPVKIIHAILVQKAINRETTTYGELATHVGLPASGNYLAMAMGNYLLEILQWCVKRGQPHLTALVVKAGTGAQSGLPGNGFWTAIDQIELTNEERRLVTHAFQQAVYDYYDIGVKTNIHTMLPQAYGVESSDLLSGSKVAKTLGKARMRRVRVVLDKDDPNPVSTLRVIQDAVRNCELEPLEVEVGTIALCPDEVQPN